MMESEALQLSLPVLPHPLTRVAILSSVALSGFQVWVVQGQPQP